MGSGKDVLKVGKFSSGCLDLGSKIGDLGLKMSYLVGQSSISLIEDGVSICEISDLMLQSSIFIS